MSQGKPIGAKLFLEGMEVPFLGATITHTVGQASIAYVEVVPHTYINDIKPRTHVMLAVRDYHNPEEDYPFVVAWEGEVFGFSMEKTPQSRAMTLQCVDDTSYWDNVLNYFFNPQQSLGKGANHILELGLDDRTAKSAGIPMVAVTHSAVTFYRRIIEKKLKESGADLLDGIVEVLKEIGKTNEFYSTALDKLRINDRILLRSSGVLENVIRQNEALDWFEKGIFGGLEGYTTLRQVVNSVLSIIFHDYVTVPFPARVQTSQNIGDYLTKNLKTTGGKDTIGQYLFKPNLYMLPPPMCNVFYPDEYSNFSYQRNFFQEPTRLVYKPTLPRSLTDAGLGISLPHVYAPESLRRYMLGKQQSVNDVGDNDTQTPSPPGYYGDGIDPTNAVERFKNDLQTFKREQQLLTNEEWMRGILMRENRLVPAASAFRQSLTEVHQGEFAQKVADYLFYKSRYENRSLQITSHLKMSVVPGFTVLLMDPGDSDQNIIAYCSSVTHRITATSGGYTQTTLSYARSVAEQQASRESSADPLVPPWFSQEVFGSTGGGQVSGEAAKSLKKDVQGSFYTRAGYGALSSFYKALLGEKGGGAVTDLYRDEGTLVGAVYRLIGEYNAYKDKPGADIQSFISRKTDRDYVRVRDGFYFLRGASTTTKDFRTTSFSQFSGGAFARSGQPDEEAVATRQSVVRKYRDALKEQRGFRG